jgi:uncharacterized OB-fold protein
MSGVVYIWRCEGCGRLYPPYINECDVCCLPPADATTERIWVPREGEVK